MSSGDFLSHQDAPKPVVQVAQAAQQGQAELPYFIPSTRGPQAGAILIEWNLTSPSQPAGLWDAHTRIGGFAGSQQTSPQCAKTPDTTATNINQDCIAAYILMHVIPRALNLFMENCWLWVSDQYVSLNLPIYRENPSRSTY